MNIIRQYLTKPKIINQIDMYCVTRLFSFKSACSLETLYPKTNLSLFTPKFEKVPSDSPTKFDGYIPINKIDINYSCSSSPGGQNVNKVNTKVDIRFNIKEASWLTEELKTLMIKKLKNSINKDGYLIVKSELTRSQQLNLADALQKLRKMIRGVIEINNPPPQYALEKHRKRKLKLIQRRVFEKRRKSSILAYRKGLCE